MFTWLTSRLHKVLRILSIWIHAFKKKFKIYLLSVNWIPWEFDWSPLEHGWIRFDTKQKHHPPSRSSQLLLMLSFHCPEVFLLSCCLLTLPPIMFLPRLLHLNVRNNLIFGFWCVFRCCWSLLISLWLLCLLFDGDCNICKVWLHWKFMFITLFILYSLIWHTTHQF